MEVICSAPLFIWLSLTPCLTTAGTGTPGLQARSELRFNAFPQRRSQRDDSFPGRRSAPACEAGDVVPEECHTDCDEQRVGHDAEQAEVAPLQEQVC